MSGLFKKWFGKEDEQSARPPLSHPKDLQKGDVIRFAFLPQEELTNQRFEVEAITTYDFEDEMVTSFTIKGESGKTFFLSVEEESGDTSIAVSRKLNRKQIRELFDEEAFAEVFEEGAGTEVTTQAIPAGLENWIGESYTEEEDCEKGFYLEGDYREQPLPKYQDEAGEPLEYYLLMDEEETFGIDIEVYSGGDTEVNATIYLTLSDIAEMWPREQGN